MTEQVISGALNIFGPRDAEKKRPAMVTDGLIKELIVPINYDDLPVVSANDASVMEIPANALILDSLLFVETAFAGGTSYNIGLYQSDGTVIDADGLDAAVLLAALTANAWIDNDGALVGASIGAAAGQVVVAATGTFTAGKAFLHIRYIDPINYG